MGANFFRAFSLVARALAVLAILVLCAWGCGALWYATPHSVFAFAVVIWAAVMLGSAVLIWRKRAVGFGGVLVALAVMDAWWSSIAPSDTRVWADDVALHLDSRVDGDKVSLYSVRNFTWRSKTDYDARWETRHYDLTKLQSVDVICSYWMGPAIAHTLVSFGFADGQYVTFSIEIRKERGEEFSAIGGFFKQFERTLVAADERDILGVRTNIREEDDYIYRVVMPPQAMRALFTARPSSTKWRWPSMKACRSIIGCSCRGTYPRTSTT